MRQCQVPGCTRDADYEVFLSEFHAAPGRNGVTLKHDPTCLFICERHAAENEEQAREAKDAGGAPQYPYTNLRQREGFSVYRRIGSTGLRTATSGTFSAA
jgi:hypothetical protein